MVNALSFLNPYSVSSNSNGTTPAEEVGSIAPKTAAPEDAQKLVTVEVPKALSQSKCGTGCSHCMSNFIGSELKKVKPGEVAALKSNAASQAMAGAKKSMLAETERHENAHFAKAAAAGLNPSAPVINQDGSGSVSFQMPTLTDANAKSKLEGAVAAALAPEAPSGQDYSVAAKAQSLLSQLGGKQSLKDDKKPQVSSAQQAGTNPLSAANRYNRNSSGLAV